MSESEWQNAHLQGSVLQLTTTKKTDTVSRTHSRVYGRNKNGERENPTKMPGILSPTGAAGFQREGEMCLVLWHFNCHFQICDCVFFFIKHEHK